MRLGVIAGWIVFLGILLWFVNSCTVSVEESRVPKHDTPQLGIVDGEKPEKSED